jgi:hypothetical protein
MDAEKIRGVAYAIDLKAHFSNALKTLQIFRSKKRLSFIGPTLEIVTPPFSAPSIVFKRGPFQIRFRNEAGKCDGRANRKPSMTR